MTTAELTEIATTGDEPAFAALVQRHRRELQVHCYRMLGSFEESEDQVQETFLRAWHKRESFAGRSTFRAWLYRIATNACLDALERSPRPALPSGDNPAEVAWLQPFPDALLDGIAPSEEQPDAVVVARETIELAFLVAIQHLPPNQRAVLIMRDVLGWSAKETAELLDTSVASANSALQRARVTLKEHLPERRSDWGPASDPTEDERAVLQRCIDATERNDLTAMAAVLAEDARFSMPPQPESYVGRDVIIACWEEGGIGSDDFGELRCVATRANRQPALANYVKRPGDTTFRPMALDVVVIENGLMTEVTTFGPSVFPAFGLAPEL